jgi:hypothetical protein
MARAANGVLVGLIQPTNDLIPAPAMEALAGTLTAELDALTNESALPP